MKYFVAEFAGIGQTRSAIGAIASTLTLIVEYAPTSDLVRAGGFQFCSGAIVKAIRESPLTGADFEKVAVERDSQFMLRNKTASATENFDYWRIILKGVVDVDDFVSIKGYCALSEQALALCSKFRTQDCIFTPLEAFQFDWDKRKAELFEEVRRSLKADKNLDRR